MKKFLSCALAIIMLFSISVYALADSQDNNVTVYSRTETLANGDLFIETSYNKSVAIISDNTNHLLDVSIIYADQPNNVYQLIIDDYPVTTFSANSNDFWINVIDYAEQRLDEATVTVLNTIEYTEPIELPQTRASAGSDLLEDMAGLLGNEYFGIQRNGSVYNGETVKIFESMDFRIYQDKTVSWQSALSVSGLIAKIGAAATSGTISAICKAFSVIISAASMLPANGKINIYTCRAMVYRYATINNSEYIYNITYKFIDYKGYENADLNSPDKAYVASDTQSIDYPDGISYFNSYSLQIEDAYDMFERIGQQP